MFTRRSFLERILLLTAALCSGGRFVFGKDRSAKIMTVNGSIDAASLGETLIHEHLLVDFIGASKIDPSRWDHEQVIDKLLPRLEELTLAGCKSFVDCTPNYLGRDAVLLQKLSERSGLNIITNTGYYGGSDHKYLPPNTFTESEYELSDRWIEEWRKGIQDTGVKPGFIKISVNDNTLSDVSKKLIKAAALTHLQTGLTIASHTGPYLPAFEQVEILKEFRVRPSAFIWVHAQNEKDLNKYKVMAARGAWVSLDGLNDGNVNEYVQMVLSLKKKKCLNRTLISHDAGWYDPAKPGGGDVRAYTTLFEKFIPAVLSKGFSYRDVDQLIKFNPAEAFSIKTRKL